jgi:hypothetical protein
MPAAGGAEIGDGFDWDKTLMQRLASVGLGRTEPNDARNSIDEDSLDIPAYLRRRAAT